MAVDDYFVKKSADLYGLRSSISFEEVEDLLWESDSDDEGADSNDNISLPSGKKVGDYAFLRVMVIRPQFSTQSGTIASSSRFSTISLVASYAASLSNSISTALNVLASSSLPSATRQRLVTRSQLSAYIATDLSSLDTALGQARDEVTAGRGTTVISVPARAEIVSQEIPVSGQLSNGFEAGAGGITIERIGVAAGGDEDTQLRFRIDGSLGGSTTYVRKVWGVRLSLVDA